jgi:hypothetical protein
MYMNRALVAISILIALLSGNVTALDKKTIIHLSTIPITEGLGIYSSVKMIGDGNAGSRTAGITNISLLALNAGLGSFIAFGKPANFNTLRLVHHAIGFTVIGTALWLTVAASTDHNIDSHVKFVSGGYTAMTTVPIFIFNF